MKKNVSHRFIKFHRFQIFGPITTDFDRIFPVESGFESSKRNQNLLIRSSAHMKTSKNGLMHG